MAIANADNLEKERIYDNATLSWPTNLAVIKEALAQDQSWWNQTVLAQYERQRYRDNQLMMTTMDMFYAGFSNDILPLKLLRNGALKLANINSPIKKIVLKYAMGL